MAEHAIENLRLLVVSRETTLLRLLWSVGDSNSWQIESVASGWEAMERVQSHAPNMLLLDLPKEEGDALHILRWLRRLRPELPVLVACQSEDAARQKDAVRLGADAVLVRPFNQEQVERTLRNALGSNRDNVEAEDASDNVETIGDDEFFLALSPVMRKLRTQADLLAQADVPVLILGETGTGKSTVARLIHKLSVRSGFRFQAVNCATLPAPMLEKELFGSVSASPRAVDTYAGASGRLNRAENGTLLLQEITEMPPDLQSKLVLLLQEKEFARSADLPAIPTGVRIMATSSANLEQALAEKLLREDLYYRLSAFTVQVPPLRRRKDEISALLQFSMHKLARNYGLAPKEFTALVVEACVNHSWPGNLNELQTVVKRYLLAGETESMPVAVGAATDGYRNVVPPSLRNPLALSRLTAVSGGLGTEPKSLKSLIQSVKTETERNAIASALQTTRWNRKAAARLLKVSYRTLLYKIDQYHMTAPEPYLSPVIQPEWKGNGRVD